MSDYVHCAVCKEVEWQVSEEDPDATLSDAFAHVWTHGMRHANASSVKDGRKP